MADASLFVRSEHDQKFDRQTRIWGAHGQRAIETARVCVLGGNATSAETLKNLVLPNVGHFTLVDAAAVTRDDVGNNFFVSRASVGRPRAEVVVEELLEMNGDVRGEAVLRDPLEVIRDDLVFFDSFHIVVASQLPEDSLLRLAAHLYGTGIPLVSTLCFGLVGTVRLAVPVLEIVETHYDNDRLDLCLHPSRYDAFPELREYCASFDLDTGDSEAHAHIPFVAVLAEMLRRWREAHGGAVPRSYAEKEEFKSGIREAAADFGKEENFIEAHAVNNVSKAYNEPELDWQVQAVLGHARCDEIDARSSNFWVLARAVRDFMAAEGGGFPPVTSDIPDMTCKTDDFLRLKAVFEARSRRDADAVAAHAARLLRAAGREAGSIPREEIDYFCKNFAGIAHLEARSLAAEYSTEAFNVDDVNDDWLCGPEHDEDNPRDLHWYFALRAVARFRKQNGRWPGGDDAAHERDAEEVAALHEGLHAELGVQAPARTECSRELVRFGPSEPHNTAAILGGIAAQVALKVILRQFNPLNNTVLHNGVFGRQTVFQL